MEKVFIKTENGKNPHAGSKARDDVDKLLKDRGYRAITVSNYEPREDRRENYFEKFHRHMTSMLNAFRLFFLLPKNSLVVMQHPMTGFVYFNWVMNPLINKKHVKFVALVHDLDSLRNLHAEKQKRDQLADLKMLRKCEAIICHNLMMKKYLVSQGFMENKLVTLELFDYLIPREVNAYDATKGIVIAGNLNEEKSGYLRKLNQLSTHLDFELYGPNYTESDEASVHYHGSFAPDELLSALKGSYGLVWDGPSVSSCAGSFGEYLRYNNSHKASLYLAVGLPVIVWQESALSKFVEEQAIGFSIANLAEIEERINQQDEAKLRENVEKINGKITTGYFLNSAMSQVEEKMKEV
ncbi:hypothetical protein BAU15_06835 [Enterococcus sp. JM4C]|uniref:beta-1,6-galactofuranosyltransferase n=1 Tax=Candidatus Enterococcus huntleyi TaxID=1857217 RepID=UPI00137A99B9|nr:beta-1,6-galactofuranosyltransferase [Enterococcus sp. JM4C]KAF1297256.1 hypothetical protein BAU15_06835 [Enterococcus sp. JM4C]